MPPPVPSMVLLLNFAHCCPRPCIQGILEGPLYSQLLSLAFKALQEHDLVLPGLIFPTLFPW